MRLSPFRPLLVGMLLTSATSASAIGLDQITGNVYNVRANGPQSSPTGSGVVIGPGQVVTACTLLAGARSISVTRENVTYDATLAAPDIERNLCLLKVPNLPGSGVSLPAGSTAPGLGQKMVMASAASGAVAVREATVTGLQASNDGKLTTIELSAAPDAAANGGALFDDAGRLAGILADDGTLGKTRQRAVPAAWVRDITTRGAAALATYRPSVSDNRAASAATVPAPNAADGSPRVGEVWQYVLTDSLTNRRSDVIFRVDRIENGRVIYNQGARIERADGTLERINAPSAGEFDAASPPSGWVPANVKPGARWKYSYRQPGSGAQTDLEGSASGESEMTVAGGTYRVIRIAYRGYAQKPLRPFGAGPIMTQQYKAVAWYAPEIGRVVKFEASTAQNAEKLELAAHRYE